MKKIHNVEWTEEKITSLWEIYETTPEFEEMFLPASFYRELLRNVEKFMNNKGKILDIGCGKGTLIEELYSIGFEVWGVNLSERSIDKLRQKYEISGKNIGLKKGTITKLPFEDNSFDYVFAVEVLEHLLPKMLIPALNEVRRILKPGGRFIATVPYKEIISQIVCPDCYVVFSPSQHLSSFDEEKIKYLFSLAKLKIDFCKLVPKIPLTGAVIKDEIKKVISYFFPQIIRFMYGSIFITVAHK